MKLNWTAFTIALLMCSAAAAGVLARPGGKQAPPDLERVVPTAFGQWTLADQAVRIIDPQTKQTIDVTYDETIARTYVNKDGYRIMLSMAYGGDQRGELRAHPQEVCYRAQGFDVGPVEAGLLQTAFGAIRVKRMLTSNGPRHEPVTYWITVGDKVAANQFERRIQQIVFSLTGKIPGGILYRVSSIDRDPERAFAMQQTFTADLLAAMPAAPRHRVAGLEVPQPG